MTAAPASSAAELVRAHAPWLLAPELHLCAVGSTALAEACRRAGIAGPKALDLDLAWALEVPAGTELLQRHSVHVPTTEQSRARGTLALRLAGRRCEITSFRGEAPPGAGAEARLLADLERRDMTVGALAWHLASDRILDPLGGLADWQARRVVACGDPAQRVAEHPVRLLRYWRRAHEWGFEVDGRVRKLRADPALLAAIAPEAASAEFRAALLRCASPGAFLVDLHEVRALAPVAPELAPQFDGRPAGPRRHHPELSQGLHMVLALEWAAARSADLPEPERLAVLVAVLCHDLGKNLTPRRHWPRHHGHEHAGLPLVESLLDRLPGLADARGRRLARAVCALHLLGRRLRTLQPRTLVRLYEEWFEWNAFPVDAFALALAADAAGRLRVDESGEAVQARVAADVRWLRERCAAVDAGALWREFGADREAFEARVRKARAQALRA